MGYTIREFQKQNQIERQVPQCSCGRSFSYYGSKYQACKKRYYPEPEYDTIVEPFAGAAGYSVNNFKRKVRLYDLDEKIYGVWHYLIHAKASEIRSLPDIVEHVDDVKACQEAKWLMGFWLSRGQTTPSKKPSTWMKRRKAGQKFYWGSAVRGVIAKQLQYIRHWKVFHKSYEDISFDKKATWYIDPPYCSKPGRQYRCNKIDYDDLADWCIERKGQVIVCEAKGAGWLPFIPLKDISASVRKGRKVNRSKEVVWINTDRFRGFINKWEFAHGRR